MQALAAVRHAVADSPAPARLEGPEWWRGAVGYELYVRSFLDTNADGVGDLPGVTARLDYLAALGVDVIWLTPFFPSPGFDHGYDVADYCDVDPLFGTLDDWDDLVREARARGLRLFVDIVPNHTSSHHEWFRRAVADPTGPYRNYYVWSDPGPDGGPPNNWVSHFGGPAWSLDPGGSGQYYCHLFLPEQPDLNWANPAVMEEFTEILHFWIDRGADGFRIDVAHGLTKDDDLRDNPQLRDVVEGMHPMEVFASFQHVHDLHRRETADVFRAWRRSVASAGTVLMGEMDTRDVPRFADYVAGRDGLHVGFVLKIGLSEWVPAELIDDLLTYQAAANGGTAWEVSNHDQARGVSRYGGGEPGLRRTLALTTLMTALDGIVFLYQGEELGLPDAILTGEPADPMSARNDGTWGRDVARGPMPWSSAAVNGFTDAPEAWLSTVPLPTELTAAAQVATSGSTWQRYRDLTLLRKRHPQLWKAALTILQRTEDTLVLRRGDLIVAANFGPAETTFRHRSPFEALVFESCTGAARLDGSALHLAPETCVIASIRP